MPPTRNQDKHSEAKIVSELGKEFNVDEVYSGESSFIGSLKSVNNFHPVEVPPSCPINFDETMLEEDVETHPPTQGDKNSEDTNDDGEDQHMGSEEEDANKNKSKTTTSRQNEKLYAVEGMLNMKIKRAEKKRRKKAA